MSNSYKSMVNGEAFQLLQFIVFFTTTSHARIHISTTSHRESISVLQVMRESISVLQVTENPYQVLKDICIASKRAISKVHMIYHQSSNLFQKKQDLLVAIGTVTRAAHW